MTVSQGDVLRCAASFDDVRGSTVMNVYHYEYSGSGDTDASVGAYLKAEMTSCYEDIEADLDEGFSSVEVEVWKWDPVLNQWDGIYSDTWTDIVGTQTGGALPSGVAALLLLYTGLPRRQGRKYIAGMNEADYDDNGWSAAAIVNLGLSSADMMSSRATDNGTLHPGVFNETTESFQQFTNSGAIKSYAGYQRRRRPGVGE